MLHCAISLSVCLYNIENPNTALIFYEAYNPLPDISFLITITVVKYHYHNRYISCIIFPFCQYFLFFITKRILKKKQKYMI